RKSKSGMPKYESKKILLPGLHKDRASLRPCTICGKVMRMDSLYKHWKSHADDVEVRRPYKCTDCDKRFTSTNALRKHKRVHLDDVEERSPFKCDECDKRYGNLQDLNIHKRRHL
ncbi:hypothetical protein PMAYCL1PPCAC_01342, partial [Pristionchus mayeri]